MCHVHHAIYRLPRDTFSFDNYHTQRRFGLHRWHITDPIRFEKNIKFEIQALGWCSNGRYLPL
jgi:hypothetical protein